MSRLSGAEHMKRILVWALPLILTACVTVVTPDPTSSPTLPPTPSATQTIEWFPATSTPTPIPPTLEFTPTPEKLSGVGKVIYRDDFTANRGWTIPISSEGEINIENGELNIIIQEPDTFLYSVLEEEVFTDFYAEITASPSLCSGNDQYGFMFRAVDRYYRYALSCDGEERLDLILSQSAAELQPWMVSACVPSAAPCEVRLGVWAVGSEFRLFINGTHQFTVTNEEIARGSLGVFARSAGETAVTVSFTDLVVREISP